VGIKADAFGEDDLREDEVCGYDYEDDYAEKNPAAVSVPGAGSADSFAEAGAVAVDHGWWNR